MGKPGWIAAGGFADDVTGPQSAEATVVLLERDAVVVAALAVRDELLPADKARLQAELSGGRPIAMVDDGVNDAPALATPTSALRWARWARWVPMSPSRPPTSR